MESYLDNGLYEYCTGCGACKEVCPKQCIEMRLHDDGFMFPTINESACIHCNKCKKVCPYNCPPEKHRAEACYTGATKDLNVSGNSSSGGIFYELARKTIEKGGIVAGAKFDANYSCAHSIAYGVDELPPLMGSKYVQSNCSPVFAEINNSLVSGKIVLFAGTPCQIAGLKNYLYITYENLYCIDVACHGVPSAADFQQCKQFLEKKHSGHLKYIKFRDKKRGGWYHSLSYSIEKDGIIEDYTVPPYKVPYYYFFLHSWNIRKSCYKCPYVGVSRVGDITLADYWRAEKDYTETQIQNGISVVFGNTVKGKELINECRSTCSLRENIVEAVIEANQPFLTHPTEQINRNLMLKQVLSVGYKDTQEYIGKKKFFIAVLKASVPEKLKRIIRRGLGGKKK